MVKSVDRYDDVEQRTKERAEKAETYTAPRSEGAKAKAKTYTKVANTVDAGITAEGSKGLGAAKGAAWGALRGIFYGMAIAAVGGTLFPLMAATPFVAYASYFGATMLYNVVKGGVDGYYKAEMNYSGNKGKEVGNKIAAEGGAQKSKVKDKNLLKAIEEAKKEIPDLKPEDVQEINHPHDKSMTFEDRYKAEKQRAALDNGEYKKV